MKFLELYIWHLMMCGRILGDSLERKEYWHFALLVALTPLVPFTTAIGLIREDMINGLEHGEE